MSIHPVFYIALLEPYRESTEPTRKQDPPMPDEVDDEPSFVVEEIVDSRWYRPKGAKFPKGSSSIWLSGQAMGRRKIVGNHMKSWKEQRRRRCRTITPSILDVQQTTG